jgi:hypothetical protein
MKRTLVFVLTFVIGGILGAGTLYATSGAKDRGRIAALESELKSKNDKLDKCTDALIKLHTNAPQTTPAVTAAPQ